jgi:hypothetical protein
MRFARTGSRRKRQHFDKTFFKTGVACRSYLLKTSRHRLPAGAALASQGPGGGPGTAGELTQMVMAIIVYGTSALVVGAGLIGVARQRRH